ncbi:hypothetical protein ABN034_32070 [Actinopolymorpha sp. B11F2]|uniref:hypothetical protein n=1 Tax=Actinopolymorpha sp. B11F2 TaxID=3160862 RepID=UPI0032E46FE4
MGESFAEVVELCGVFSAEIVESLLRGGAVGLGAGGGQVGADLESSVWSASRFAVASRSW